MFALVIDSPDGSDHTMRLITGDDAKIAEVNLGTSETIGPLPVVADIDDDGDVEIIVSKDTLSGLDVQAWSPELECDASGWVRTGHSNERLWTWSDADYSLSAPSPHLPSSQSGTGQSRNRSWRTLISTVLLTLCSPCRRSHRRPTCWTPAERRNACAPLWEVALDRVRIL